MEVVALLLDHKAALLCPTSGIGLTDGEHGALRQAFPSVDVEAEAADSAPLAANASALVDEVMAEAPPSPAWPSSSIPYGLERGQLWCVRHGSNAPTLCTRGVRSLRALPQLRLPLAFAQAELDSRFARHPRGDH